MKLWKVKSKSRGKWRTRFEGSESEAKLEFERLRPYVSVSGLILIDDLDRVVPRELLEIEKSIQPLETNLALKDQIETARNELRKAFDDQAQAIQSKADADTRIKQWSAVIDGLELAMQAIAGNVSATKTKLGRPRKDETNKKLNEEGT